MKAWAVKDTKTGLLSHSAVVLPSKGRVEGLANQWNEIESTPNRYIAVPVEIREITEEESS